MKEFFLTGGTAIGGELRDVEIPTPQEGEILIKVIATSANPADWKSSKPNIFFNHGHDIAGIITSLGPSVTEFAIGQRVVAMHRFFSPHGAYAEYAIAPIDTTFHLPPNISFEEGSTIPLAGITAALALYQHLHLPLPWNPNPTGQSFPILIYGASTAVGAFAMKFAKLSGCSPIIAVAGKGIPFVKSLEVADVIIDYRTPGTLAEKVEKALPEGMKVLHAFDVISEFTWRSILEVLPRDGTARFTCFWPIDPGTEGVEKEVDGILFSRFFCGGIFGKVYPGRSEEQVLGERDFGMVFFRYISILLKEGRFRGHPYEVLGGLDQVAKGAEMLRKNEVSSKKLVYRITDTPGI